MSEKENIQKTDFLSNLRNQKPNTTAKVQDETMDDDLWNEGSDEDEEQQVTKISNKMASNLLAKEDNSKKKYTSLKDIMGDKKNTNYSNNRKNPYPHQNKKPQNNTKPQEMGFNKPVFLNSNKFYNKNEGNNDFNNINNNNNFDNNKFNNKYEYKQMQNYNNNYNTNTNSSLTERPKFFNNKPADENKQQSLNQENIVDKYNMSTNNVYSNTNKNNNNNTNEKEDTLKKIGTFNTLVKDLQEENAKIKAPKRDYTEIDFTKDKYNSERNKEQEKNYLQKPQFVSKHVNEEPRFVELEKDKDLFLKNVQKTESQKESPGFTSNNPKREKFHNKNKDYKEHKEIKENKEKDNDFGLEEPRRFINSKKQALNENQTATNQEDNSEQPRKEADSVNNENQNYGSEYKKFKKHRDDFTYYDRFIKGKTINQEEKHDNDKLSYVNKETYKSHYTNSNTQKNVVRKVSDGKDNKSRKNSALPEPIILKKTDKTLKELLDGK